MDAEHGIIFNKPHKLRVPQPNNSYDIGEYIPKVGKTSQKIQWQQNTNPYTTDRDLLLIPLSVIGDNVLCLALINRHTMGATEWEPSQAQYSPPISYYMIEDEFMCYFSNPPLKEFVEKWKIVE